MQQSIVVMIQVPGSKYNLYQRKNAAGELIKGKSEDLIS